MFRRAFLRTLKRLISCLFVLWSITVYWGGVIYFLLQNLFLCINGRNCRLMLWSENWERYFCVSCWYVLESDVRCLGVSFYYKAISVSATSTFFSDNGIYLRMQAFNVSNYFSHSFVLLTRLEHTCGVKVKKTQLSENIFACPFGESS